MLTDKCPRCDGTGWVCENHRALPWNGTSDRKDACGCGAGAPCAVCVPKGAWPPPQEGEVVICSVHSGWQTVH